MKATQSRRTSKVKNITPRRTENVKGGRDAATGLASGKRQHGPVTITKE
jgi:hypothetical protein